MIKINFDKDKFLRSIEESTVSQIRQGMTEKVHGMVCSVHGQGPRLPSVSMDAIRKNELKIDCCCEDFRKEILETFK